MNLCRLLLLFILCSPIFVCAQNNVGIGTTTPTHQLHTTGTVRHQLLSGLGTRMVYVDSNGVLQASGTIPVGSVSNNSPLSIPDTSCIGIVSTLNVTGLPNAASPLLTRLKVNINHPELGALTAYLVSPYSDTLNLFFGNFFGGDLVNTTFTDLAANDLIGGAAGPATNEFKPFGDTTTFICFNPGNISSFKEMNNGNTMNPNGTWRLIVNDLLDVQSPDTGSLVNWTLEFYQVNANGTGVTNYFPHYNVLGNLSDSSSINEIGGHIGIGAPNPATKLQIEGNGETFGSGRGTLSVYSASSSKNNAITAVSGPDGLSNSPVSTIFAKAHISGFDDIPFISANSFDYGIWGQTYNDWDGDTSLINGYGGIFSSGDTLLNPDKYVLLAGTLDNPAAAFMGGKVGIGTISPAYTLEVVGSIKTDSLVIPANAGLNKVLTSDAAGNASWQTLNETDPQVGIISNNTIPKWNTGTGSLGNSSISDNGTTVTIAGNTSISGTATISGGAPGLNKVLRSDATGNATWVNANTLPGTIASMNYSNGLVGSLIDNGTTYGFMGATQTVTITTGQKVEVTATCALGTTAAAGATMSRIAIGQKLSAAANPSDNGADYITAYRAAVNTRNAVTLSTIFTSLVPGTYTFGMIYQCTPGQAANWNSNDWSRLCVKVIN